MSNNKFPTVATIIGCPEQLSSTNGLVATPISAIPGDFQTSNMAENSSQIKDPIQRAVIDNICGKLPTKTPVVTKKCDVCKIECNGEVSYKVHIAGARHAKRLKEQEIKNFADLTFIIEDKQTNMFTCSYCNTSLNALSQLDAHLEGAKHKSKSKSLQEISNQNSQINSDPSKLRVDATPNLLYCATCNIHVNSSLQLAQHTTSKKHINKVNGKKPIRFVPYTRKDSSTNNSGKFDHFNKKIPEVVGGGINGNNSYHGISSLTQEYQNRWIKEGNNTSYYPPPHPSPAKMFKRRTYDYERPSYNEKDAFRW